jgi:hypothetical protein
MSVVERAVSGKGRNQHEKLSAVLDAVVDVRKDVPLRPIVGADLRPGAYAWRQLNQALLLLIALTSTLLLSIPTRTQAGVLAGTCIVCLCCVGFAVMFACAKPYTAEHAWKLPLKSGSLVLAALVSVLNMLQLVLDEQRLQGASASSSGPGGLANATAAELEADQAHKEALTSTQLSLEAAVQGMSVAVFVAGCLLMLGLLLAFANILLEDTSCTLRAFRVSRQRKSLERRSLASRVGDAPAASALASVSSTAREKEATPEHIPSDRRLSQLKRATPSGQASSQSALKSRAVASAPAATALRAASSRILRTKTHTSAIRTSLAPAGASHALAPFAPTQVRKSPASSKHWRLCCELRRDCKRYHRHRIMRVALSMRI